MSSDTKGVIRSRNSKDKQHNGQRSERVMLFKFNSSIIPLYQGDEKVIFNNVMNLSPGLLLDEHDGCH
jgi:hypothetical protein